MGGGPPGAEAPAGGSNPGVALPGVTAVSAGRCLGAGETTAFLPVLKSLLQPELQPELGHWAGLGCCPGRRGCTGCPVIPTFRPRSLCGRLPSLTRGTFGAVTLPGDLSLKLKGLLVPLCQNQAVWMGEMGDRPVAPCPLHWDLPHYPLGEAGRGDRKPQGVFFFFLCSTIKRQLALFSCWWGAGMGSLSASNLRCSEPQGPREPEASSH